MGFKLLAAPFLDHGQHYRFDRKVYAPKGFCYQFKLICLLNNEILLDCSGLSSLILRSRFPARDQVYVHFDR